MAEQEFLRLQPAQPRGSDPAADAPDASQPNRSEPPRRRPGRPATSAGRDAQCLVSLDAYRGCIMIVLAASGFGIAKLAQLGKQAPAWELLSYDRWQRLAFHFSHPPWVSQFGFVGVSFWDLIQPAFMFMVGVAMPYSYARRQQIGHSRRRQLGHAAWRALVLILMGVFLQSTRGPQTNWMFTNVLSQIGLGYFFVYLLLPHRLAVQAAAFVAVLCATWGIYEAYDPPADYDYAAVAATDQTVFEGPFASWSKNANNGYRFDRWLLNLFPRDEPFEYHSGGYVTLNFLPSIATMLLGVFCGQLLRSDQQQWLRLLSLIALGAGCLALAILASWYVSPVVKRLWTPSWVLLSGGWVVCLLVGFHLLFDLLPLRPLAFPLVVVGMNSIVMYLLGQLMRPWTTRMIHVHFGGLLGAISRRFTPSSGSPWLADEMLGRIVDPTLTLLVFWLIVYWMYRQKFFVRV